MTDILTDQTMDNLENYVKQLEELDQSDPIKAGHINSEIQIVENTRVRIRQGLLINEDSFITGSMVYLRNRLNEAAKVEEEGPS